MMASTRERIWTWLRRISTGLLWALGVLLVGAVIGAFGVRLVGGVQTSEGWLEQHRFHLVVWRLALYTATLIGWCWMRQRLLLREPDAVTRTRLRRTERAALAVIVTLECMGWLKAP